MRPAETRRDLTRRRFLRLAGSAAAGALLYPLASPRGARAQPPAATPPTRVLIEDLTLGPGDFAAGAAGAPGGEVVSPVLHASTPFTHIGVHWSGAALGFAVRSSTDGVGWTPWQAVTVETLGRETASGDTFGALVGAGRASRVQLRVAPGPGGATPALGGVTVTLLNAVDGPAIETTGALPDEVTVDGLTVVTREGWGSDERLRFVDGETAGSEIWPRMYVPTKKAVVHHTATSNTYSEDAAAAEVRAVYTYHAVTLGWGDIGYSSLVDTFGNVYEGRHGRGAGETREVLSADVVAGHALSHNYGSTGVALIGTHTQRGEGGKPGVAPTPVSWTALTDVLAFECARRGIDPQGANDFLRSDDAWNRGLANVPGHRDCNPTICPGGHVYDRLGELRADVALAVANAGPSVTDLSGPSGDPVTDGLASYDWTDDDASAYQYYLEGWQRLSNSEDITYLTDDDLASGYHAGSGPAWTPGGPPASFDGLVDGHYTLHVRASDGAATGYEATHTLRMENGATPPPPTNTAPVVAITSPADGSTHDSGATINFAGTATDVEDGDLTASLVWTSDIDGALGVGGSVSATLSDGEHTVTVTASATDSGGLAGTDAITITVGDGGGGKGWGKGGKR